MPKRSRQAKLRPRRRDARQSIVVAAIAGVLAVGLVAGRDYVFTKQRTAVAAMPGDEEIYTGSILFMPEEGPVCRQLLFDNQTGRFSDNGLVDCLSASYQTAGGTTKRWPSVRVRVISDGFRQR